jgi:hypothetical protein
MLSNEAKQATELLLNAVSTKKIERRFAFLVINERNVPDHTKSLEGIIDPTFHFPVNLLQSLYELEESDLIEVGEHAIQGGKHIDVRLKNGFSQYAVEALSINDNNQTRLFISYSSRDRAIKNQIEDLLLKTYSNLWSDKTFIGGEKFWPEIFNRIEECDIFIYLMSPESIYSFACRVELSEAMRLNKHIVPVLIYDAKIPSYIRTTYHCINATKDDANQINNQISSAIKKEQTKLTDKNYSNPLWQKHEKLFVEAKNLKITTKVPARVEPTLANKEQLNTGILLLDGDTINISASGQITNDILDGQPRTWISPSGMDQWKRHMTDPHSYWKSVPIGALVGWVGGIEEYDLSQAFPTGESYNKTITQTDNTGFLYLAINDSMQQYNDNGGEFVVAITTTRKSNS